MIVQFKSGEGRKQLVHQLKDDAKLKDENDLDANQQDDVAAVRSWISEGVFDAINNQYLRCLCFCVHAREDSASLSASSSSSRELSNGAFFISEYLPRLQLPLTIYPASIILRLSLIRFKAHTFRVLSIQFPLPRWPGRSWRVG